jgi:UDP-N-acetylglucosamine--N-acetylmuramyl-(pentapeptide) pyrophosphoryl-undecaprenol N-acetylglucosamine transferase
MEQFFPSDKIVKTGNPVRADLIGPSQNGEEAKAFFGLDIKKPTLLILGGSLGARRIDQLIEAKLDFFKGLGLQVIWQCGKLYFEEYKKYSSDNVKVFDFLDRMDMAYSAADIIISRAGAGSVSELCIAGKPVIFIPSPNVAEDHQTKNAQNLVAKNAAVMVAEKTLDTEFENRFLEVFRSKEKQREMEVNIKKLALPNATKDIVDQIEKLLINEGAIR